MSLTFYLQPQGDVQFGPFLNCAREVHDWGLLHDNWDSPLLGKPSGCPELDYEEGEFDDEGHKWNCINTLP